MPAKVRPGWWETRALLDVSPEEAVARLRQDATALLRACEAWAVNGWCAYGPRPRPDCTCDWHQARAAVRQAHTTPRKPAARRRAAIT